MTEFDDNEFYQNIELIEDDPVPLPQSGKTKDKTGILENMKEDQSWLSELKLAPVDHLLQLERTICPKCNKKRKYFCYDCFIAFGDPEKNPKLNLPIKVDVIHYPTEAPSKSTSIHCKVMAYDDVNMIQFNPDERYQFNYEETLLLYPSDDAEFLEEVDLAKVKKVVFIESQWHNTKRILSHPDIYKLKCVKIDLQKTMFWRHQRLGDHCLATIEAIYYFFKEYHQAANKSKAYNGEYDNILYYYSLFYNMIQYQYKANEKPFRNKQNYIN